MDELALLGEHLRLARCAGMRFDEAWPVARAAALNTCPPGGGAERYMWGKALHATRPAWCRAYERRGRLLALSLDIVRGR